MCLKSLQWMLLRISLRFTTYPGFTLTILTIQPNWTIGPLSPRCCNAFSHPPSLLAFSFQHGTHVGPISPQERGDGGEMGGRMQTSIFINRMRIREGWGIFILNFAKTFCYSAFLWFGCFLFFCLLSNSNLTKWFFAYLSRQQGAPNMRMLCMWMDWKWKWCSPHLDIIFFFFFFFLWTLKICWKILFSRFSYDCYITIVMWY